MHSISTKTIESAKDKIKYFFAFIIVELLSPYQYEYVICHICNVCDAVWKYALFRFFSQVEQIQQFA